MARLEDRFVVASGSIVGREHVRLHRNNQDGLSVRGTDECIVAVVTDGCSSGRSSEVGARLGAAWLAEWCPLYWRMEPDAECFCRAVALGLAGFLADLGRGLGAGAEQESWRRIVNDHLLFTLLVAVVGRERSLVFGIGDGVFSVNGKASVLEAGPGNAPPYLAYRLVGKAVEPCIHHCGPTEEIKTLLVGTDGLAELEGQLEDLEAEARYEKNPSLLHKRLVMLSEGGHLLQDDATAAVIRRRALR
jgi:protein phosphatase 2C-like protein